MKDSEIPNCPMCGRKMELREWDMNPSPKRTGAIQWRENHPYQPKIQKVWVCRCGASRGFRGQKKC